MQDKDVCVLLEEVVKPGGIFSDPIRRYVVFEYDASGRISYIFEGDPFKLKYKSVPSYDRDDLKRIEINKRIMSGLLADGWVRIGKERRSSIFWPCILSRYHDLSQQGFILLGTIEDH